MYGLCDVWTVWCMDCVVYGLCDAWTGWCMNCVMYQLCGIWPVGQTDYYTILCDSIDYS